MFDCSTIGFQIMDSEKEVLLPDSIPSSPTTNLGQTEFLTTSFVENYSPVSQHEYIPLHSTPVTDNQQESQESSTNFINRKKDKRDTHLEPETESRHHSLSHSVSGGNYALPHSGSRHSLASRGLANHMTSKDKRKEQRKQKTSQLPAHGEVQKMEHSLLQLLNEFNSGQLRAFDSAYSLEQMESVRDQQEAIARKHFELGAAQDLHPPLSDEGLAMASENLSHLMSSLEGLSQAIGQLSCLDRMVERAARGMEDVREGSQLSFTQQKGH